MVIPRLIRDLSAARAPNPWKGNSFRDQLYVCIRDGRFRMASTDGHQMYEVALAGAPEPVPAGPEMIAVPWSSICRIPLRGWGGDVEMHIEPWTLVVRGPHLEQRYPGVHEYINYAERLPQPTWCTEVSGQALRLALMAAGVDPIPVHSDGRRLFLGDSAVKLEVPTTPLPEDSLVYNPLWLLRPLVFVMEASPRVKLGLSVLGAGLDGRPRAVLQLFASDLEHSRRAVVAGMVQEGAKENRKGNRKGRGRNREGEKSESEKSGE